MPLLSAPAEIGLTVWALGHRGDVETLFDLSSGVLFNSAAGSPTVISGRLARSWRTRPASSQLPIAEGDSGAPIVNYRGELVGVISAFRNQSPYAAAFGPDAASIRKFLEVGDPAPRPAPSRGECEKIAERLARSTVWVRPTATGGHTAGVVIELGAAGC